MKNNHSSEKEPSKVSVVLDISKALEDLGTDFNNAFILTEKGNLLPREPGPFPEGAKLVDRKFKTSEELAGIVLNNGKALFGEQTVLLDCAEKNSIQFPGGFIPHGLLFDVREKDKPRLFFIEVMLAKENIVELFKRMTSIFYLFRNQENINQFLTILDNAISRNIGWRNKLKPVFEDKLPSEFLQLLLSRKPGILLSVDSIKEELTPFRETYTETWGKLLKPIVFRKFEVGEDTLLTMVPSFTELTAKVVSKEKVVKVTEEDHLENASEIIREIFLHMKTELLKLNSSLEFRVKGHYISMRKDRNIAFFQLGRKKLSIVIANPEKGMREQIKSHAVRTLAESVKKFWNGNENCFTVVIEKKEHLEEVLNLLKKLAGANKINGNEPASKVEDNGKKETKEPPKSKAKAKQGKSDKKLQTKKK